VYLVATDTPLEISQDFDLTNPYRVHIKTIAVWLLLNDPTPGSTLKLTIRGIDDSEIYSETKTIAEIKTTIGATQAYAHGKYIWEPASEVRLGRGVYSICLEQTNGYSFTNFIAWCKDWESTYYPTASAGDWEDPYYVRLYDHEAREIA
jgi:hypothetical protein